MSRRTRLIGAERYVIEITEFALQVFHHGTVTYLRRQVSLPAHGAIAAIFLATMTGLLVCLNLGTRYVEAA